jgi:hypothetical protein
MWDNCRCSKELIEAQVSGYRKRPHPVSSKATPVIRFRLGLWSPMAIVGIALIVFGICGGFIAAAWLIGSATAAALSWPAALLAIAAVSAGWIGIGIWEQSNCSPMRQTGAAIEP